MRPHVTTEKHLTQVSLATVAAGALTSIDLIDAVAVSDKNNPNEVEEGSIISAILNEYWITTDNEAAAGTCVAIIEKVPANAPTVTTTNMGNLNNYVNKKNILKTFMGLTNPELGVSMPVLQGWIKIPKGKQRFGLGDVLRLTFFSQTGSLKICGFSIYKEQK